MNQTFTPQPAEQHPVRKAVWTQWDAQTNDKQAYFIQLNNLYLAVERGTVELNIHTGNTLRVLVGKVYPYGSGEDMVRNYWQEELQKLPGWDNV